MNIQSIHNEMMELQKRHAELTNLLKSIKREERRRNNQQPLIEQAAHIYRENVAAAQKYGLKATPRKAVSLLMGVGVATASRYIAAGKEQGLI